MWQREMHGAAFNEVLGYLREDWEALTKGKCLELRSPWAGALVQQLVYTLDFEGMPQPKRVMAEPGKVVIFK